MDDERVGLAAYGIKNGSAIPEDCRWPVLRDLRGEELTRRYSAILEKLSRSAGIVGTIFLKAQNEIQDPAKLRRLVGLIDGETWLGLGVDVKGSVYEGLLERNAQEVKSGAGRYFTPRADRCDLEGGRSRAARDGARSSLRHRWLSARGLGAHAQEAVGAQCRSIFGDAVALLGDRYRA